MVTLEKKKTKKATTHSLEIFFNRLFYERFVNTDILDFDTTKHSERVSWLSALTASDMIDRQNANSRKINACESEPLDEDSAVFWRSVTQTSGLLHDLGKVIFSRQLLEGTEKISKDEWKIIIQHPIEAVEMLKKIIPAYMKDEEYVIMLLKIIEEHHERWDGVKFDIQRIDEHGGYPNGLKGNNIAVPARIIKVVDSYDARTTRKKHDCAPSESLKPAYEHIITLSGKEFDPEIVNAFEQIYRNKIKPINDQLAHALIEDYACLALG